MDKWAYQSLKGQGRASAEKGEHLNSVQKGESGMATERPKFLGEKGTSGWRIGGEGPENGSRAQAGP